jgi:hypothetical protein
MTGQSKSRLEIVVGASALGFSALYFLSDLVEAAQGEFTRPQLWMTLIAEIAIPFFVFGLYWVRRDRFGPIGRFTAYAYAYAYIFFTYTVIYALVNETQDYDGLADDLAPWMLIHGAIMVFAGIGLGYSIIKSRPYPHWTGIALIIGVVLVAATQGTPVAIQLLAAGIRDLAFAGMGLALLLPRSNP